MPLNFPTTGLTAGETTYTYSGNTWIWNGYAWDSVVTPASFGLTAYVTSVNGLTGVVTGIAVTGANTFTGLQTMNSGLTANNLWVSQGATFGSNLTVLGNLTVSGGVTSSFSETVLIEDNFILLNSNVTGGTPTENAGIEISRGGSANVQIRWNETNDSWDFTNNGTNYYNFPTEIVSTLNGRTGAFTLTGTANEVEITGATSFVVGLPDTVTIANLTVTNSVTASHFEGSLVGRVTTYVKNDDSITLTAGMPVYISGQIGGGNSGVILVKAADASNSSTMPAIGLVETTLTPNDQGHVVEIGLLTGLNTSGYTANQVVYVASGGGLTATRPTSGTHLIQNIGRVVNTSSNQGNIIILGPGRSNDVPNRIVVVDYLQMPNGQTATSLVTSWNGASGAVTYSTPLATSSVTGVASFGNEFSVSALGAVGLTSNYVKSINGATGAITGIAVTGANTFTESQIISGPFVGLSIYNSILGGTGVYSSNTIQFYSSSGAQTLNPAPTNPSNIISLPNYTTTLAGLAGVQTFTGLNTFNSGITSNNLWITNGATFAASSAFTAGLTTSNLWVTAGSTFAASSAFTAGLTTSNLWVTAGSTFAARSAFTAGLTTSNLWVTAGSTFAGRAAFTAGITGSGTISGFTGIHGPTNGSMLRIWSGPWNTINGGIARIEIDGSAGGDISLYPVSGQVTIKRNPAIAQIGQGAQLRIQSGDGSSFDYWSTISTGTVNANRTYTLPDLTGTLAVVDAAQSFTALQSFNSGLTTSHLWVTNGATFAATVAGATANFTGLVSSTVGFSGAATNLIGNASGLTAGTSTKSIITDTNSSSTHYPVFVSAAGNIGLNVDSSTTPLTYVPSTGTVTATTFAGTNSTVSNTLSVASIQEYISGNGISVTSLARFSAGISAAGGITFGSRPTFTAGLTTDNLYVTNGATFTGQVTVTNFKANTIGGDEGGQIDLGIAATNTTLSSGVSIDIYQNRLRFFESGGTNRGAYIDLSAASAGVGSNLLSGGSSTSPPLASASVTGVASFGNEFVVSALGAVSLTANYVKSVNGSTGAVVSIAVTGANTFTGLQTMNAGITASNLYVSSGATFAGTNLIGEGNTYLTVNPATSRIDLNCPFGQVRIGDVEGANNGTNIQVEDSNEQILLTAGQVLCSSEISATTNIRATQSVYFGDNNAFLSAESVTLGTTASNQNIAGVTISSGRTVEFFVQASHSSGYEALKILAIHDGTNTYNTQYGLISTGSSLCSSYTTTVPGGGGGGATLRLRATPTNTNTTFKVVKTVIIP